MVSGVRQRHQSRQGPSVVGKRVRLSALPAVSLDTHSYSLANSHSWLETIQLFFKNKIAHTTPCLRKHSTLLPCKPLATQLLASKRLFPAPISPVLTLSAMASSPMNPALLSQSPV